MCKEAIRKIMVKITLWLDQCKKKNETYMHNMEDVSANLSLGNIKVLTLVLDRCGTLVDHLV